MEKGGFRRIRRIILGRVLLVPFLVLMVVCSALVYYFAVALRQGMEGKVISLVEGHRALIEQFLRERVADLRFASASYTYAQLSDEKVLAEVLEQLQSGSQAFFDLGVFDEKGIHVAYVGPYKIKGWDYSQAEWFLAVQKTPVYISDVFLGKRRVPHFIIAVRRVEGNRTWYLRATIDTVFFNDLVERIRIGRTGEAYLINKEGVFQTRRRSGGDLMQVDPDRDSYRSDEERVVSFTAKDSQGSRYLYAAGRLGTTGWLLVVRQHLGDAYAPLVHAVLVAVGIMVLGGTVVLVMAFVLASGIAHRLTLADMEKTQMRSQLLMAEKLAEIGEMSAGVAHEINNPLQIMKSEQFLINDMLDDLEHQATPFGPEALQPLRESVRQIGVQIDRCKQITHGLLGFARHTEPSLGPVDLEKFVAEMVSMVEHRARLENVRIVQQVAQNLPPIVSDHSQLQQVMLNLLNNALYALKGRPGPEIRITVDRQADDIVIAVADNGVGIPQEHMEKIFLPFFTTRPVGQGTGLGLSTCLGIVERLGGTITVASEVNVGTVFTVRLPVAGPPQEGRA